MNKKIVAVLISVCELFINTVSAQAYLDYETTAEQNKQIRYSIQIEVGESYYLGNGTEMIIPDGESIEWIIVSMDPDCISLSQDGTVTALNPGDAVVEGNVTNGDQYTYEIHVYSGPYSMYFIEEEYYVHLDYIFDIWDYVKLVPSTYDSIPVTVTSSDPEVISVEDTSLIVKSKGTSVITVISETGLEASATFHAGNYADYIASDTYSYYLYVGESVQLEYSLKSIHGFTDFSDEEITWESEWQNFYEWIEDPCFVMDENHIVTATACGSGTITAKLKNGKKRSWTIIVKVSPERIWFTSEILMQTGQVCSIWDYMDAAPDGSGMSPVTVTSTNPSVISTWEDMLTAESEGWTLLTVNAPGSVSVSCLACVGDQYPVIEMQPGETKKLTCEYIEGDPEHIQEPVSWYIINSADCGDIKILENGTVIADGYGMAAVVCIVRDQYSAKFSVYSEKQMEDFDFIKSTNYMSGKDAADISHFLNITPEGAGTHGEFSAESSNPDVIYIENGNRLVSRKSGTANITVKDKTGKSRTAKFITGHYAINITNNGYMYEDVVLGLNKSINLQYSLMTPYFDYYEDDIEWTASDERITWKIEEMDNNCISLSQDGEVTGLAYGDATVSATILRGNQAIYKIHIPHQITDFSFKKEQFFLGKDQSIAEIKEYLNIEPYNAVYYPVKVTSSNKNVIASGGDNYLQIEGKGTAVVTACIEELNLYTAASFTVGDYGNYLEFSQDRYQIPAGSEKQIEYVMEFTDSDNSEEEITWTVIHGNGFISVDQTGKVKGVKAGHGAVRAEMKNGKHYDFEIDVVEVPKSIAFEKQTYYVSEEYRDQIRVITDSENSHNADFIWTVSDPETAYIYAADRNTVDILYKKDGSVILKAQSPYRPDVYAECTVVCYTPQKTESMKAESTYTGYTGYDLIICPEFNPETASRKYTVSLSNGNLKTILTTAGKVQLSCEKAGSTDVSLNAVNGNGSTSAKVTVADIPDSMIRWDICEGSGKTDMDAVYDENPAEYICELGKTYTFRISHLETDSLKWNREDLAKKSLHQSSLFNEIFADENLGRLMDYGWKTSSVISVKAVKTGTMKLPVTDGRTITVKVVNPGKLPESVSLPSGTVDVGSYKQLEPQLTPDGAADSLLTWTSSNNAVAVVDFGGNIFGKKVGKTTINVKTSNGKTAKSTYRVLFTDVPTSGVYFSTPVYWAVEKGITNGYTDDDGLARQFGPDRSCTREAVVTFLWRLAGKPNPKSMESPFKDVQDSSTYYFKAVLWAAEQGITGGYFDGTFRPADTCLREHVVTFLWRYAGKPKVSTENTFTDVKNSDYYYKAVLWAAKNNITKGYADDNYKTFRPKLECLREHVVTFLYRYAKLK